MRDSQKQLQQRRDEWIRELRYRQRNIVFPETAMNAGRYWRNLTSRKYPFTRNQKIGFAVILLLMGPALIAALVSTVEHLIVGPSDIEGWASSLVPLGILVIAGIILVKASIAVFGKRESRVRRSSHKIYVQ